MNSPLFLMTVDCDHFRGSAQGLRRKSLEALLDVFAETGLAGHVTWFVNESYYDYSLIDHHQPILQEILRRGDTPGVHDHIDLLDGRWEYKPIYDCCERSKEKVAGWLSANGSDPSIRCHRFGCLFQRKAAYAAVGDLGYTVVSDVWPGHESRNHTGHPSFDNRAVPVGIRPYRHDASNWQDHASRTGHFLHIPVMHMYLRDFELEILLRWTDSAEDGPEPLALTWLIHPYEIINDDRNDIARSKVEKLRSFLREIAVHYQVEFVNMEACAAKFYPGS